MSVRTRRIHPQAQTMLERIAGSGEPLLETVTPAEARRFANARVANSGWTHEPLHAVGERVLPGPGGNLRIRIYRPNARQRPPLIVFFHGGGFMVGNLDTHDALCRVLAARTGSVLLAVDYRLAPENPFPAAPEDCVFAARWAFTHAEELGVDASRLAVVGESSGGNLSAVIAQAFAQGGPRLALQVLIYPSLDMAMDTPSYRDLAEGFFYTRSKAQYFIDHYLASAADVFDPRASPLRAASLAGVCPALIIAAALDPMVDEAAAYADRLREAGVAVDFYNYEGWPHGFLFWAHTDAAQLAMDCTVNALRKAFE
ncbi:MAG: alpha/beta hydrolase [Steroidobacteraceae bacterium]